MKENNMNKKRQWMYDLEELSKAEDLRTEVSKELVGNAANIYEVIRDKGLNKENNMKTTIKSIEEFYRDNQVNQVNQIREYGDDSIQKWIPEANIYNIKTIRDMLLEVEFLAKSWVKATIAYQVDQVDNEYDQYVISMGDVLSKESEERNIMPNKFVAETEEEMSQYEDELFGPDDCPEQSDYDMDKHNDKGYIKAMDIFTNLVDRANTTKDMADRFWHRLNAVDSEEEFHDVTMEIMDELVSRL